MSAGDALAEALVILGFLAEAHAVVCERRMHRHRQPGISYWAATLRRDGGWRRPDLFDAEGLRWQRLAARSGVTGAALWMAALVVWVVSRAVV